MDIQEYISSGILELYVSGALPEKDMEEVQRNSQQYPEILKEIEAIEATIMAYASSLTSSPTTIKPNLEEILLPESASVDRLAGKLEEAPIRKVNWRIWAVAASVLLFASIILNVFFFSQWKNSQNYLTELLQEKTQLTDNLNQARTDYQEALDVVGNPDFIRVSMNRAKAEDPDTYLTFVFWNPSTEKVYVQLRNLPDLDPQVSQYQLWAIKEGKDPISMGVFEQIPNLQLQAESVGGEVVAFAITEEPKGGSISPTLEKMRVIGNVPNSQLSS